jgi:dipeptidyl aminopeptidase/acylaminoacyl peptidase
MARRKITVDDLWACERIGGLSLSPDGAQAVASVSRYDMQENKGFSSLYLFSTFWGAPRHLTQAGEKDSEPRFSPTGDLIAFVAKREQEGKKDDAPQLYVIAPDGGEARRVTQLATGVSGIKWFADGKRVAFISWVWPHLKGSKAQDKAHKEFKDRKESAYVTEEHVYRYWDHNLPQGRVPHLHVVDIATGRITDLFEGSAVELLRAEPNAGMYDISPDGKSIAFSYDPQPVKRIMNRAQLAAIDVRTRTVRPLITAKQWDLSHPRYAHNGGQLAFVAAQTALRHTAPAQLAVGDVSTGKWQALGSTWDREVAGHLAWSTDDTHIYFAAEDHAQCHLWRYGLKKKTLDVVARGGWVQGFDVAGDTVAYTADSMLHPARAYALREGQAPVRMEQLNDALLAQFKFGPYESVTYKGARGHTTQIWVVYPPNFDPKKKYPLLHSIHGGPHTASGDTWHYRWNNQVFASGNSEKSGAQEYVVACVNYHGSTSFGFKFKDSITHQWGALELADIEAATDLLTKKPYIDKTRVFATGGSYGGYMVAWMNGHAKPGRYKAYVCHAGCYDWVSMFASDGAEWFKNELGAWYWDDMKKVHAQSPHAYSKHFSTPTLVLHGQLDYRVPDAQAFQYYNTLKAQDIDARLVWFPDENHWILKPRNSKLWYREFFSWLAKHDPTNAKKQKAKK